MLAIVLVEMVLFRTGNERSVVWSEYFYLTYDRREEKRESSGISDNSISQKGKEKRDILSITFIRYLVTVD